MYIDTDKGLVYHNGIVYKRVPDEEEICERCSLKDKCEDSICPDMFFPASEQTYHYEEMQGNPPRSFIDKAEVDAAKVKEAKDSRIFTLRELLCNTSKVALKSNDFQRNIELL